MQRDVINRQEMLTASLNLGGAPISLADYATTGLAAVAVGPRGCGKTNACLLMAEQLTEQGWVAVLIDPEQELEKLYHDAVADAEDLRRRLIAREQKIVVVRAHDATEFIAYGEVILQVADAERKPMFVVLDEGQLFSSARKRAEDVGKAGDIINEFIGRGRKRALDTAITTLRYSGTLHRSVFSNKNLTLIGCQEDATAWSALAPQFRSSRIEFSDLAALAPSEFFCISRTGVEKVTMPMAKALEAVAMKAKPVARQLPGTFSQWDRAMRSIPTARLEDLDNEVIALLGTVTGLTAAQMQAGVSALNDELELRT